ncbi:MAG: energy transducer TonB [Acidobacteria bacterium]|nr:energy transducer TonB [Acidobacteriota bacterium]
MKAALLIFVIFLATPAAPQGAGGRYAKDGLAFDYAAGWTLADTGDAEMQRLMLRRDGASNIIFVFAQRRLITTAMELYGARSTVTMPYVTNIANKLGLSYPPSTRDAQCIQVDGRTALGFRMSGMLEGAPTTAEVYTVLLGQRLLHLVHVRAERDEAAGAAAWKTLTDTLKVDAPANPSPDADKIEQIVAGGVLNGKAIKKPQPSYPAEAKMARAQGTVAVQIVIDEEGKVASAKAVSGPTPLHGASVEAARKARFEPTTLCGKPVKVTGVITYGFVLR